MVDGSGGGDVGDGRGGGGDGRGRGGGGDVWLPPTLYSHYKKIKMNWQNEKRRKETTGEYLFHTIRTTLRTIRFRQHF